MRDFQESIDPRPRGYEMSKAGKRIGAPRRVWVALFSVFAVVILAVGYGHYVVESEEIRQVEIEKLGAIAHLKVNEIVALRKDRLNDARTSAGNPFFRHELEMWLEEPDTPGLREEWNRCLVLEQSTYTYSDVLLLNPEGQVLMAARDHPIPENSALERAMEEALANREPVFSEMGYPLK